MDEKIAQKRKFIAFSHNFLQIFSKMRMSKVVVLLKIREPPDPRLEARDPYLSDEKC